MSDFRGEDVQVKMLMDTRMDRRWTMGHQKSSPLGELENLEKPTEIVDNKSHAFLSHS